MLQSNVIYSDFVEFIGKFSTLHCNMMDVTFKRHPI